MSTMDARSRRVAAIAVATLAVVLIAGAAWWFTRKNPAPVTPSPVLAASQPAPSAVVAAPQAPFSYHERNATVDTELELPRSLSDAPELRARLYAEGVRDLKNFADGAAGAQAEESGPVAGNLGAFTRQIVWSQSDSTSKLISLERKTYEFAGGAHPNTTLDAILWDRALKRALAPTALFRADLDTAKLDAMLCNGLMDAKKKRLGQDYAPPGETWSCPKWTETSFALAPSTTLGKAGGLTFLFSPSSVGAYAEGPYEVTLPQAALHGLLAPAYVDDFAGSPVRAANASDVKP